jgi:hypothetical protein
MSPNNDSIRHGIIMAIQMALSLIDLIFLSLVDSGYSTSMAPLPWDQRAKQRLALPICETLLVTAYSVEMSTLFARVHVLKDYLAQPGMSTHNSGISQSVLIELSHNQTESNIINKIHAYDPAINKTRFAVTCVNPGVQYHRFLSGIYKEVHEELPTEAGVVPIEEDITRGRCCVIARLCYPGFHPRLFDGISLTWMDMPRGT